jgi:Fic family protein
LKVIENTKGSNVSEITIPDPSWGSDLANIILDLEKLRTKQLGGDVPPYIFFQLKELFQILETIGSARIEGNNTTLSEYVEKIIEEASEDEQSKEIRNLENAIRYIEDSLQKNAPIDRTFISDLHKILTQELSPPPQGEGSRYPGELRKSEVAIKNSGHTPPSPMILPEYFEKFIAFINEAHKEQYQLLMVAIAHHRFEYIHPFDNGNGRMGRLLNYALLIKLGFQVKNGRILNPSSVFYADRDRYYDMLSLADSSNASDLLAWSEYFLSGMKNELEKIDSLLRFEYVRDELLLPMLHIAKERQYITELEHKILVYLVNTKDMAIKSSELERFGIKSSRQKSYTITKLKEKKMLLPTKEGGRIYTISFGNSYLLRTIMEVLDQKGFVSEFLK